MTTFLTVANDQRLTPQFAQKIDSEIDTKGHAYIKVDTKYFYVTRAKEMDASHLKLELVDVKGGSLGYFQSLIGWFKRHCIERREISSADAYGRALNGGLALMEKIDRVERDRKEAPKQAGEVLEKFNSNDTKLPVYASAEELKAKYKKENEEAEQKKKYVEKTEPDKTRCLEVDSLFKLRTTIREPISNNLIEFRIAHDKATGIFVSENEHIASKKYLEDHQEALKSTVDNFIDSLDTPLCQLITNYNTALNYAKFHLNSKEVSYLKKRIESVAQQLTELKNLGKTEELKERLKLELAISDNLANPAENFHTKSQKLFEKYDFLNNNASLFSDAKVSVKKLKQLMKESNLELIQSEILILEKHLTVAEKELNTTRKSNEIEQIRQKLDAIDLTKLNSRPSTSPLTQLCEEEVQNRFKVKIEQVNRRHQQLAAYLDEKSNEDYAPTWVNERSLIEDHIRSLQVEIRILSNEMDAMRNKHLELIKHKNLEAFNSAIQGAQNEHVKIYLINQAKQCLANLSQGLSQVNKAYSFDPTEANFGALFLCENLFSDETENNIIGQVKRKGSLTGLKEVYSAKKVELKKALKGETSWSELQNQIDYLQQLNEAFTLQVKPIINYDSFDYSLKSQETLETQITSGKHRRNT
jgi:hypothetical protein